MDGSQDRRSHKPCIGQGHEVIVAVNQIKLGGVFEGFRDVKVFGYFGIDRPILFVALIDDGVKASAR